MARCSAALAREIQMGRWCASGAHSCQSSVGQGTAVTKRSAEEWWEEGIQLFNEEKYFECHEAWEEIWKLSSGEEKTFLQGMIQAAVAILHSKRGNAEGASSLREKSQGKLETLPDEYRGIELAEFRTKLEK